MFSVLSYQIAASLKEDVYGAMQRDIPCVLEVFLSFLQAVEHYVLRCEGWG
jgi:nucleoporin NDC1